MALSVLLAKGVCDNGSRPLRDPDNSSYIGKDRRDMPRVLVVLHGVQSQSFELEQDEVLYDGVERHGLKLPHGCLSGACGACKVIVLAGADNLDEPCPVEKDTLASIYQDHPHAQGKVIRLGCRAKVRGQVEVTPLK